MRAVEQDLDQMDLDGVEFQPVLKSRGGDVDPETQLRYHQDGIDAWATYSGGGIKRGFLVGVRDGASLSFRYVHLRIDGATATGRCESTVYRDEHGRLVLDEAWTWESEFGTGTSRLEEVRSPSAHQ